MSYSIFHISNLPVAINMIVSFFTVYPLQGELLMIKKAKLRDNRKISKSFNEKKQNQGNSRPTDLL